MCPVNHIKPYDVPFHLRAGYEKEVLDMVDAGIIATCDVATLWNTKAFLVAKRDGTSCRLVGDWRGVNCITQLMQKCSQLVIDAASGYHQLTLIIPGYFQNNLSRGGGGRNYHPP